MKPQKSLEKEAVYIGIDYHKRYSVFCVIDRDGEVLERGRIEHVRPEEFRKLVGRWKECRVVFETSMNWHWLFEILEEEMPEENITIANPFRLFDVWSGFKGREFGGQGDRP